MKAKSWIIANKWIILIMVIAAVLRLYRLDFQSLWIDEVLSLNDANPNLSWKEFYDSVLFWEAFPHMYFAILKIFLNIFGFSSFVARILSAIIGILGVWSMYLLGKEAVSKNLGLAAALLTAVNEFHIFYSQEVRPYGLFFLLTVAAFYRLVIFVRNCTYKNAILYGIFAGLMCNTHFLALVMLFAHSLILIVVIIASEREKRKSFTLTCLAAAGTVVIFLLPIIEPIVKASEIKSFWIPAPTAKSLVLIFIEFFNKSYFLASAAGGMILFYLFKQFNPKRLESLKLQVRAGGDLFVALLLILSLTISIVIPLIKSYASASIILSRYFVNILPILILMVCLGLLAIKSRIVRMLILIVFVTFSLVDLIILKKYYSTTTKAQLSEMTTNLIEKNPNNAKVVTTYFWILKHFLDQSTTAIEPSAFEEYVLKLKQNPALRSEFWYADFNSRPYSLKADDEIFLQQNFLVVDNLDYFDAWAKHYVPLKQLNENDFSKIELKNFTKYDANDQGIILFSNGASTSQLFKIDQGNYEVVMHGKSVPETPLKNENAHIRVAVGKKEIGQTLLSSKADGKKYHFPFTISKTEYLSLKIIFDNDLESDGEDRNAIIDSVSIVRK